MDYAASVADPLLPEALVIPKMEVYWYIMVLFAWPNVAGAA